MGPRQKSLGNNIKMDVADDYKETSMGPRQKSLGNAASCASVYVVVATLQWGRGKKSLGNEPTQSQPQESQSTSMGPRQKSLGNVYNYLNDPTQFENFNGAEAKKPRKFYFAIYYILYYTDFNGAEAKKPRKSAYGYNPPRAVCRLQWGRGKKASEI